MKRNKRFDVEVSDRVLTSKLELVILSIIACAAGYFLGYIKFVLMVAE